MMSARMIIKKFPNYALCTHTFKVVNITTNKALKPQVRKGSKAKFFKLYDNGVPVTISLFNILQLIFNPKFCL